MSAVHWPPRQAWRRHRSRPDRALRVLRAVLVVVTLAALVGCVLLVVGALR